MRKIFILVVLVVLVACVAIPAFAAVEYLDYNDYVSNVVADGENDIVTCEFAGAIVGRWESTSSGAFNSATGLYYTFSNAYNGTLYYFPFGDQFTTRLSLDNVPDGTVFTITFDYDTNDLHNFARNQSINLRYWDKDGNILKTDSFVWGEGGGLIYASGTVSKPAGAVSLSIFTTTSTSATDDSSMVTIGVKSFTMELSISSLYRQSQLTGKTNELLESVEDQLAENGQTLDDILEQQQAANDKMDEITDYVPEPDAPSSVTDSIGDLQDVEDSLLEGSDDALADYEGYVDDSITSLTQAAEGFAFVSALLDRFTWIPFFYNLLVTSLTFGLLGSALNLTTAAIRSSSRSDARSRGKAGKNGG